MNLAGSSASASASVDLAGQIEDLRAELDQAHRAQRKIDHRAATGLQIAATALRLRRRRAAAVGVRPGRRAA